MPNLVAPLVGAWVEISIDRSVLRRKLVAPLVGAWVEITVSKVFRNDGTWSLPSWERGLKYLKAKNKKIRAYVAPLVGAWVEIGLPPRLQHPIRVAPLVGAWVEIDCVPHLGRA